MPILRTTEEQQGELIQVTSTILAEVEAVLTTDKVAAVMALMDRAYTLLNGIGATLR